MGASLALRHAHGRGPDDYDVWDQGRVVGNIVRLEELTETWFWDIHVSPTRPARSGKVASLEEAKAKFLHEYGLQLANSRQGSVERDGVARTSVVPVWKIRLLATLISLFALALFFAVLRHIPALPHGPIVQTTTRSAPFVPAADGASVPNNRVPSPFFDCSDCPEMVVLPAGRFMMGTSEADETTVREMNARDLTPIPLFLGRLLINYLFSYPLSEEPQHSVTIPRPFAMGKYPVTRGEFAAFVRESGYVIRIGCTEKHLRYGFHPDAGWSSPGFAQTERDPVVCVSWNDAQAYVTWLNRKIGAGTTSPYRLPSESEWEYGARAGTQTLRWWGNEIGSGNAVCDGCGSRWDRTAPVDDFRPNPYGLSDTLGNVFEWTEDCAYANYEGAPADGNAWAPDGSCGRRVTRGAGFFSRPSVVRAAQRTMGDVGSRESFTGFRVAKTLP